MVVLRTGSRLHFGLLGVGAAPARPGLTARRFGGVGLMVESPGLWLEALPAPAWSAEGALAGRALAFAERFARSFPLEAVRPQHFRVRSAPPEHAGLGTGTQLGLAVARLAAAASGRPDLSAAELAVRVGRGRRSGLGVHGFAHGGLLVDGGKGAADAVAPLVARFAFPPEWLVVLVVPPWSQGLHGDAETRAFEQCCENAPVAATDALSRLVLLGVLPAVAERDFTAFGEAIHEFNRRAGEVFAAAQGGVYVGRVGELVAFLRGQGARGAGQSSWGPAVFAFAEDPDRAGDLARRVRARFGLDEAQVQVSAARSQGAELVGTIPAA